jgi:hypothetical protein
MEVRSILFPVDSSARCYAAVPCVAAMARLFDASIYLLRPAKDPPPDLNFEGSRVVPAIRYGDADDEITNFATTRHIGMIMMATYSQEVFSNARCPVWMAAVRNEAAPPREPEIRSLLCAIDLGLQSRLLVRAAEFVGERAGAKVRLVYAVAGEENEIAPGAAIGFERYIKRLRRSFRGAPAARDRHLIRSVHGDRMAIARNRGRGAAPQGRPRNHGTRRY